MSNSTIIVIPCYNEAQRLPVRKFTQSYGHRFFFINDGSTDGTQQILQSLRDFDPDRFNVCNLPKNTGKGEAVRKGILLALEDQPEFVGYWDADLATPLDAISRFSELLRNKPEIEIVFGARVQLLGRSIKRSNLRHYLGRMFATAASLVLGLSIYDTQCGAKLFRVLPGTRDLFIEPFLTKWLFDVEIIARLIRSRSQTTQPQPADIIYELPLSEWRDVKGSKVRPKDFVTAFIDLAIIYWKYLRND
ncbi:MAG: glycosyltransferase [Candidatus Binatia bacterium]